MANTVRVPPESILKWMLGLIAAGISAGMGLIMNNLTEDIQQNRIEVSQNRGEIIRLNNELLVIRTRMENKNE